MSDSRDDASMVGVVKMSNNYTIKDSFDPNEIKDKHQLIVDPNDPSKAYKIWASGGMTGFRPVIFKPTASFAALKAQRKLGPSPADEAREVTIRGDVPEWAARKHFIPGYTGYIRGMQHIQGRTFGEATNRALERDYRELACSSPIPSSPPKSRKIPLMRSSHTYVGAQQIGQSQSHIPGYTGYLPKTRDTFGLSFGQLSTAQIKSQNSTQDRAILDMESESQARPLFRREMMHLDSAPLPGGIKSYNPPQKLIPSHLSHVRYLAY